MGVYVLIWPCSDNLLEASTCQAPVFYLIVGQGSSYVSYPEPLQKDKCFSLWKWITNRMSEIDVGVNPSHFVLLPPQ